MQVDYNINDNDNNCKLVNIVWTDRGIMLSVMNSIVKHYSDIKEKKIVIQNDTYRDFAQTMFPELHFSHYKHNESDDDPNNFYFNIRNIIKKQDIVIDYLKNYNHHIHTQKLHVVPWYDMNDPLITYDYYQDNKVKPTKYLDFINKFSKCRRGRYKNNKMWDTYIENKIFLKYNELKPNIESNFNYSIFNKIIMKNYIPDKKQMDYPKIYYVNNNEDFLIPTSNYISKNKKLIKNYEIKIKELEKKLTHYYNTNIEQQPINPKTYQTPYNQMYGTYKSDTIFEPPLISNCPTQINKTEEVPEIVKMLEVKNEENINFLLNILNNKLELVNKIIENN